MEGRKTENCLSDKIHEWKRKGGTERRQGWLETCSSFQKLNLRAQGMSSFHKTMSGIKKPKVTCS